MKNNQSIIVGVLAGIAAGIMMIGAFRSGVAAIFPMFFAPAAIYIAAMGWGSLSGLIAVIAATALIAFFSLPSIGILCALVLFIPAGWVGHLTNLADTREDGTVAAWYPLSGILFQLMLLIGAGCILSAYIFGYSPEELVNQFAELIRGFMASNPDALKFTDEQIMESARVNVSLMPILVPSIWLAIHVVVAYFSAVITHKSGRLARPLDDIAATIILPRAAIGLLAAGIAGFLMLQGVAGDLAKVVLGVTATGFGFVGLAGLHLRSRGNAARGLILTITYVLIVLLYFPIFFFTIGGLMRSLTLNSNQPGPPGNNSNTN